MLTVDRHMASNQRLHSFYSTSYAQILKYATTSGKEMVGASQLAIIPDVCKKSALAVKVTTILWK